MDILPLLEGYQQRDVEHLVEAMARAMYEGESLQRIEDGKMSGQVAWDDTSEGVRAWWVDRANEAAGVLTDAL